jgi:type I restriction enzyme S subunit
MSRKLDLSDDQLSEVKSILNTLVPDRRVCAFGSRANGKARLYSDLDIVIYGARPLSLDKLALLREAFDESDLPYKVDIVDYLTISKEFQKIIDKTKISLN